MVSCRLVRRATPPLAAAACATLAACTPAPVVWDDGEERRVDPPAVSAATGAPAAAADSLVRTLVSSMEQGPMTTSGTAVDGQRYRATPGERRPPDRVAVAFAPPDPTGTRCPASLRLARAPRPAGGAPAGHAMPVAMAAASPAALAPGVVAVWWAARPDQSAALYLSRTADGGRTWGAPLPVDTLDRSESGCDRPAPSVAVDSTNGYVHVAYSMRAPEGPGVFYAHQMDPRAAFERPQVIVYGDRPAATSVSSRGDRVVVAYEDPNTGGRPFVSMALSRTAGHVWAERVPVTGGSVAAERPVVALRGRDQLLLGWVERTAPRVLSGTDDPRVAVNALPSGVVVRVGRLRE